MWLCMCVCVLRLHGRAAASISSADRVYLECIRVYLEGHLEALAAATAVAQPVAREEIQRRGLPRHAAQRLCSSARRRRAQLTAGDLGGGGQHGDRERRPSHDDRVALARRPELVQREREAVLPCLHQRAQLEDTTLLALRRARHVVRALLRHHG